MMTLLSGIARAGESSRCEREILDVEAEGIGSQHSLHRIRSGVGRLCDHVSSIVDDIDVVARAAEKRVSTLAADERIIASGLPFRVSLPMPPKGCRSSLRP